MRVEWELEAWNERVKGFSRRWLLREGFYRRVRIAKTRLLIDCR